MKEDTDISNDVPDSPEKGGAKARYHIFELTAGAIAVIALLAMMMLVFADVIGRYLFAAPIAVHTSWAAPSW